VILVSYLVIHQNPKHIEYSIKPDVEFDETNGSQGALENLDDVGDEPLREAMKNMPIGAIKPKEDEEEVQKYRHAFFIKCTA
jgi:hypothetical protein